MSTFTILALSGAAIGGLVFEIQSEKAKSWLAWLCLAILFGVALWIVCR
jgi:heme/copper-type cytochrome/quinol oxidase subunit 3